MKLSGRAIKLCLTASILALTVCTYLLLEARVGWNRRIFLNDAEVLRAKLEEETRTELAGVVSVDSIDWTSKYLNAMLGKVEKIENQELKEYFRNPLVVAAIKEQERSERRWKYLLEVEKETIPETVAALRKLNYSELFSPKLGNPGLFGIPVDVTEYIHELMKEPRIQKLMHAARSAAPQDREELLTSLDEDWETYRFGEDSRPNGFSPAGKPRECVPLLLAALDQRGEMLGRLAQMAREYSENFEANSHPATLERGQGGSNQYSSVLGTAMEIVLMNIAQSKSAPRSSSLHEYWSARRSLAAYGSERVEASALQRMLDDPLLGEKSIQDTPGIIPLFWHLIYANASRDFIAQHLPDWFVLGSPDWLVISIGCKVDTEIELDQ